jgi:hypothetical protein
MSLKRFGTKIKAVFNTELKSVSLNLDLKGLNLNEVTFAFNLHRNHSIRKGCAQNVIQLNNIIVLQNIQLITGVA